MPEIENKEFKEALIQSLDAAQLLSPNAPGKYTLLAKLVYVKVPKRMNVPVMGAFADMASTVTAKYIVVENATNEEIYNKILGTNYTATTEDALSEITRLQLAQEVAARKNITKFISDLYRLKLKVMVFCCVALIAKSTGKKGGSYEMYGFAFFRLAPCNVRLLKSDACRPALLMDALMIRRALFERSELARPPVPCVHLFS